MKILKVYKVVHQIPVLQKHMGEKNGNIAWHVSVVWAELVASFVFMHGE